MGACPRRSGYRLARQADDSAELKRNEEKQSQHSSELRRREDKVNPFLDTAFAELTAPN